MIDVVLKAMATKLRTTGAVCAALACLITTSCGDDQAAPPPATAAVVQNKTTNIIYETTDSVANASDAGVARSEAEGDPSDSFASTAPSAQTRDLASTGLAPCDAYLARVEICSRKILPKNSESNAAFHRITSSLDSTRRAWRDAAQSSASTSLARTCADAMRTYNESISNYCPIDETASK